MAKYAQVPVKLIYDFQKGELHTTSRWGLWRLWDSTVPENKNWMTEGEFQEALADIDRDKGGERRCPDRQNETL